MINFFGNIDGIPLYVDEYMKDNEILKGRKQSDFSEYTYGTMMPGTFFMIANPKTAANMLYKAFQKKLRRKKLLKINE